MKSSTLTTMLTPPKGICEFCGLGNYLTEGMHPCCALHKRSGATVCPGCDYFRKRWERGETCPHVDGVDKATNKPKRACCTP